jgi:phosphohistidine phosphatase
MRTLYAVERPKSWFNRLLARFLRLPNPSKIFSMSRILYLVRHATAENPSFFQPDHDRELTPEGIMEAARMGRYLTAQQNAKPNRIVSSTAARALKTAQVMAEQLAIEPGCIEPIDDLFNGGPRAYLAAVNGVSEDCTSLMLVGHNPDISYLAEFLTHQAISSMEKGEVIAIQFDSLTWAEVSARTGTVLLQIAPNQVG